jgi:hypothetical protein
MGYLMALVQCWACGQMFTCNPLKVPSIRVGGEREPICENCVTRANEMRAKNGMPLIEPAPDAYTYASEDDL